MNKTSTKKRGFVTGLLAMVLTIMMTVPMLLNSDSFAAPKAPGKVSLTRISAPAYNKIKINWKKVSGATHYKIYYRKSGTKKWNGVKTVSSKYSSYTHTSNKSDPIVVGQKYEYTVKGYNSKSKTYGKYNTKGLRTQTRPQTVSLTGAYSDGNTVNVYWQEAKGCDTYKVYRKTESNSKWTQIASLKAPAKYFTDHKPVKGKKNIYTVKSYYSKTKANGKYNSKGVSVKIPGTTEPEKPSKPVMVTGIDVTPTNPVLKVGESMRLSATVYPINATNKEVIWENENPEILKMEVHGNSVTVTGLDWGEGEISISAKDSGMPMNFITVQVGGINGNGSETTEEDVDAIAKRVGVLTNEVRVRRNREPLIYSEKLQKAAMLRAKELAISFSHTRPDGSGSNSIGALAGAGNLVNENIARGYRSPREAVDAWENSPGHLASMGSKDISHMGAGYYKAPNGETFWVQIFAGDPDVICTITFDPTGGRFDTLGGITEYKVQTPSGQRVYFKDIPVPVKDGYVFDCWVTEYGEKLKYEAGTRTLYATWIKN